MEPFDPNTATPAECVAHARSLGLGSRRKSQRESAESAIGAMGTDSVTFLVKALSQATAVRTRRKWAHFGIAVAVGLADVLASIFLWPIYRHESVQVIMNAVKGAAFISLSAWAFPNRVERHAADILRYFDDFRSLPGLISVVNGLSETADKSVRGSIHRIVARMSSNEATAMDETSRFWLLARLREVNARAAHMDLTEREFALSAVRALCLAEEDRAIPVLRRIADNSELLGAGLWARNAASAALPDLESAAEARQRSGTLLRPTECPREPLTLVTPAVAPRSDDMDSLVRSAENPKDEVKIRVIGPGSTAQDR